MPIRNLYHVGYRCFTVYRRSHSTFIWKSHWNSFGIITKTHIQVRTEDWVKGPKQSYTKLLLNITSILLPFLRNLLTSKNANKQKYEPEANYLYWYNPLQIIWILHHIKLLKFYILSSTILCWKLNVCTLKISTKNELFLSYKLSKTGIYNFYCPMF